MVVNGIQLHAQLGTVGVIDSYRVHPSNDGADIQPIGFETRLGGHRCRIVGGTANRLATQQHARWGETEFLPAGQGDAFTTRVEKLKVHAVNLADRYIRHVIHETNFSNRVSTPCRDRRYTGNTYSQHILANLAKSHRVVPLNIIGYRHSTPW